ncbi:MAG: hypothetical protein EB121_05880 [Alphaproteobacteria bacterium]|nr:hypothetical protein [Alphaproteobacteria bacterium]NDG04860.1 hypothetical protein [Alphaproteobacteria bacterium]
MQTAMPLDQPEKLLLRVVLLKFLMEGQQQQKRVFNWPAVAVVARGPCRKGLYSKWHTTHNLKAWLIFLKSVPNLKAVL